MRGLAALGFGLCALATASWLPLFTHPLASGVLMSASLVGLVLAAAHWRAAGLALASPSWLWFASLFDGMDAIVALSVGTGLALAMVGEIRRSSPLLVGGLLLAGIVQSLWILTGLQPGNPYLLGNVLFTSGTVVAAIGLWRTTAWTHTAPAPETVK